MHFRHILAKIQKSETSSLLVLSSAR